MCFQAVDLVRNIANRRVPRPVFAFKVYHSVFHHKSLSLWEMAKMRPSIIVLTVLLILTGCNVKSGIKINRDSVKVIQGKYNGETVDLTFYADLTAKVEPEWTYWDKSDGRFHRDEHPNDGTTLCFEVFNPFGELDLKTMSDKVGSSETVTLPLPVFWTEDNPYEYTLRVTFYYNAKKQDSYSVRFRLNEQ